MPPPSCRGVDGGDEVVLVLWSPSSPREKGRSLSQVRFVRMIADKGDETMDWDKVRKNYLVAKRGTSADNEIVATLAPVWRNPFKTTVPKSALREQAADAHREWELRRLNGFRLGQLSSARSVIANTATA